MPPRKIPLYDLQLSGAAIKEANAVLRSGWLATGPRAAALEKEVAGITHARYVAAVSSATSGLELALAALSAQKGTEVITTPFTFVATVEVILRAGLRPLFADIDPVTLNIDPDEVARKITPDTLCVMPVDIAGHMVDYAALKKLCDPKKIPIIADAAHSLGALTDGKTTAQLADAAVHSFQATKNVAAGDGGVVVSRHKPFIEYVRLLSRHAMSSTAHDRRQTKRTGYDVVDLGFKANLTDLQAAVALGQLSVFEKNQAKREKLVARYIKRLAGLHDYLELPPHDKKCRPAWHLFIIRLHLSRWRIDRDKFIAQMARAGIECGVHFKPIFELSYYRELGYSSQFFPNAAYAGERVVSLPLFPELKLSDVDHVCDAIEQLARKSGCR